MENDAQNNDIFVTSPLDPDYAGYDDNLMLSVVCSSEQPSLTWAAGDILIDPGPDLTLIIEHHCIQNGSRVRVYIDLYGICCY